MRPKLSLVTLGVKDLKRSIEFYRDGLGWPTNAKDGSDGVAFFALGGIILALFSRDALAKDAGLTSDGTGFSGIALAHNCKSEKEVDDVMAQVKTLGMTITKNAATTFWGGYSGYFSDPDGHLWEVAFNPFWKFDENDNMILGE